MYNSKILVLRPLNSHFFGINGNNGGVFQESTLYCPKLDSLDFHNGTFIKSMHFIRSVEVSGLFLFYARLRHIVHVGNLVVFASTC